MTHGLHSMLIKQQKTIFIYKYINILSKLSRIKFVVVVEGQLFFF